MSSSTNGQWYPQDWPDRIRALAAGEITPVTPKLAATVVLLRDSVGSGGSGDDGGHDGGSGSSGQRQGPLVHMLRRRTSMPFAGGAYAYPGGGVDPRDEHWGAAGGRRPGDGWAGPSRTEWAERFRTDEATAQAIVCAAVRETFEEAGVLLAGPDASSVVDDTTGEDWERDRSALAAHELSFADFLERRGLVLRSDLLGGWARWITPEFEARRYDTWFFVAALPEGQRTRNASTEADRTVWIRPADAAARYDSGELLMMPPTIAMLRQLAPYGTAAEALHASAGRDLSPVLAKARLAGDQVVLSWPGYDEFTKRIDTAVGDRSGAGSGSDSAVRTDSAAGTDGAARTEGAAGTDSATDSTAGNGSGSATA